jgi:nucleoside-diphosphate-sugar epimerase
MQSLLGRSGHDLVVDCLCFTASDAAGLLDLADGAESTIMISTKAVYGDDAGSNVNSQEAPRFSRPITESQPVMAPGLGDPMVGEGYGSHKVAAEQTLLESDLPVTIIRPSKIHGPGGTQPREWIFVKRCLDRRPAVVLADRGQSIDHTTAAANLAALVEVVAHNPGRRILNSADPDSPTALDIARTIANHLDHDFDEYLLSPDADPRLGIHPWMTAQPIILDTSAATALGYTPVGDYADTVAEAIEWMHRQAVDTDDGAILPGLDNDWFAGMFDYDREDRYITEHQTNGGARVGDS